MLITVTVVIVKKPRVHRSVPGWILKEIKFNGQALSQESMHPPNTFDGASAPIAARH